MHKFLNGCLSNVPLIFQTVASVIVIALICVACVTPAEKVLPDLAPSNSVEVIQEALEEAEEVGPDNPHRGAVVAAVKTLSVDSREHVRRKAARTLGIMHAEMTETDIQNVCKMLRANDAREVIDALKALRDLNAPSATPAVVECLRHSNVHVIRDACRTLAVIGNKAAIPAIEPLLKNEHGDVRKDAEETIAALNAKS